MPDELVKAGTAFSGGMGCLCGVVAGTQVVIGYCRNNEVLALAKKFVEEFKSKHKAVCCRALTSRLEDFYSKERRAHCVNMVESASKLLSKILEGAEIKSAE